MKVKAAILTGIAFFSLGVSVAEADFNNYSEQCTDPACYNSDTCGGRARCCEIFGNMGSFDYDSVYTQNADDNNPTDMSYDDFRGTDEEFNQHTYNSDGPIAYK